MAAQQILSSCRCPALRSSSRYHDSVPRGSASVGKRTVRGVFRKGSEGIKVCKHEFSRFGRECGMAMVRGALKSTFSTLANAVGSSVQTNNVQRIFAAA